MKQQVRDRKQGATPMAAVYCRISQDAEGKELGVQRQEKLCRELAASRGWPVAKVYTDNDISATSGKKRPEWERLLQDIEDDRVTAVVAYSSSRMYRRPADLQRLVDLAKTDRNRTGIEIATVVSGNINLNTADGRMIAGLLAQIDQAEAERTGERIRAERRQTAESGRFRPYGHPGYGYRRVGDSAEIVSKEAETIRAMAQLVADGHSPTYICRWLESQRIRTPTGKQKWNEKTIAGPSGILRSPRIAGLLTHKGETVGKGNWPPIITPTAWRKINAILDARQDKLSWTPPRAGGYLLSGLVVCGVCDKSMIHSTQRMSQREYRLYMCQHRDTPHPDGHPSIASDVLEGYVKRQASVRAAPAGFAVVNPAKASQVLLDEQASLEAKLEELAIARFELGLSNAEFLAARKRLAQRLEAVQLKIEATAPPAPIRNHRGDDRSHIEMVVKRIVVVPDSVVGGTRYRSGRGIGRQGRRSLVAERTTIEWFDGVTQVAEPAPEPKPKDPQPIRGYGRGLCEEDRCLKPAWARNRCHWHYKIWKMENVPGYREKYLAQKQKATQRARIHRQENSPQTPPK